MSKKKNPDYNIGEKKISIFDFIVESEDSVQKNIDSGSIVFFDKSFNNILIPQIFYANNNFNYKYIGDLSYFNYTDIRNQIRKNQTDKFDSFMKLLMRGFKYYQDNLEDAIKTIANLNILSLRIKGLKLNDIGIKLGLTRERVRQIEASLVEEVNIYINTYLEVLYRRGRFTNVTFFDFNDIFSFFVDDEIKRIVLYTINFNKEYLYAVYNPFFSCYVNTKKNDIINQIVCGNKLEKYFNYYDNYTKINNKLVYEKNILDFNINIYLNYLQNNNYLFRGNLAYIYGQCSINSVISMVIKNHYPQGIILDEKGIKEFSLFINNLLNYPFKVSSALVKIDELNDELILWGKQKRIHIDNVGISKELTEKILTAFRDICNNTDYLLFDDAFLMMASVLNNTNITDKYKLYGFIKYHLSKEYYFKKMTARKLDLKYRTISDIVYEYILSHDLCTKEQITSELSIPKASLSGIYRDKLDIICVNEKHTLISRLNLKNDIKEELHDIIIKEMNGEFVHKDVLFSKYEDEFAKSGIVDSSMLYQILRYYFEDELLFNSPYIQNKDYDKPVTIKNVMLQIFEKNNYIVTIDKIIEGVFEKIQTRDFSLVYNLRVSEINYFRMNRNELTLFENVIVDDIVHYMIYNRLKEYFTNNRFLFMKNLKDISKGLYYYIQTKDNKKRYAMDLYSLTSYIEKNSDLYKVFNSSALNNYVNAKYVVTEQKTDVSSYIDVIYDVLKSKRKNNKISKTDAVLLLKEKELLSSIPQALVTDGYIEIIENEIIFKKP